MAISSTAISIARIAKSTSTVTRLREPEAVTAIRRSSADPGAREWVDRMARVAGTSYRPDVEYAEIERQCERDRFYLERRKILS